MNYLLILITVLGTVTGQIILKYGQKTLLYPKAWNVKEIFLSGIHNLTNIYFIGALLFALIAALSWALVIQKLNLSFAYPFMALSYVLIVLSSALLFKETTSLFQATGIILIVMGIIFIGLK